MSFGAAISSFFSKYATFSGRARRSEFWFAVLFTSLVSIAISIVWPGTTSAAREPTTFLSFSRLWVGSCCSSNS